MNQTKKRLAIIKIAISMTDTETIQLQILKLELHKTDNRMKDILKTLKEHNYAHAERLISSYLESDYEAKVIQRTSKEASFFDSEPNSIDTITNTMTELMIDQNNEKSLRIKDKMQQVKDQAIIDQFQLFTQNEDQEDESSQKVSDYDDFLSSSSDSNKISNNTNSINYDTLLKVEVEDVSTDKVIVNMEESNIAKNISKDHSNIDITNKQIIEEIVIEDELKKEKDIPVDESIVEMEDDSLSNTETSIYSAISYIDQKFKNLKNQYPPQVTDNEQYDKVNTLLLKIKNDSYSELEIEELIQYIDQISTNKVEAAHLLLIASATESKYAQFRLARDLYQGKLLQKNVTESFTLMHRLAMNDLYPEAICDLGQFYENGIGINRDKKKAKELYKEAMDLGIHRAKKHYTRIIKRKGLFSIFKK